MEHIGAKKSHFPFIVKMDDELLSLAEIDHYTAEANNIKKEIDGLSIQANIAGMGVFLTSVTTGFSLLASVLIYLVEEKNPSTYVYLGIVAFIGAVFFNKTKWKCIRKIHSICVVDRSELVLIDGDAAACDQLNRWMAKDETVKRYVEKIGALGRLPTFAEFHCVEKYIKDKERKEPVENLKAALNLKTA